MAALSPVLLLKSLVNIGLLSDEDYQRYMNGLTTVSSQMIADRRNLSKEAFLEIRPSEAGNIRHTVEPLRRDA